MNSLKERDAVVPDHPIHVDRGLLAELAHDHVKGIVDDRLALGALHPAVERRVEAGAEILNGEVDQRRRAAVRGGDRAGLEVVGRRGAAKGHVEVRVHVDAAGHDELTGGVNDGLGRDGQPATDERDDALVDVEVARRTCRRR